jgi:hypothetical protein
MTAYSPLCSHAPMSFSSKPEPQSAQETTPYSTARLLYKSHWNLNRESDRPEPRLRLLLGHIAVYDRAREQARDKPMITPTTYAQCQIPSFEAFRAALRVQLETITQIRLATIASRDSELQSGDDDEDEDDSDYDSYDGEDWSDDEADHLSEDSLTDSESDGQISPTATEFCDVDDSDDVWAIRPLTPCLKNPRGESSKETR